MDLKSLGCFTRASSILAPGTSKIKGPRVSLQALRSEEFNTI